MGKYSDLEIIKKLKDDGDITLEEFEEEKKKILSRPDEKVQEGLGLCAACSILGLCSLLFGIMGIVYGVALYVSVILGITAIVLGIVSNRKLKEKSGMAKVGIITGILGTVISVVIIGMVIYSVARLYTNKKTNVDTTNTTNTTTTNLPVTSVEE